MGKLRFLWDYVIELLQNVLGLRNKFQGTRRLDGKVVVITGANTGIGKETALQLSLRGGKIITGCRDVDKANAAIEWIRSKNPKADISVLKLDLSSLTSVRDFATNVAKNVTQIDLLV
ncbi:unnamed protein product, partial [Medioppia subpectinata]